MDNKISFPKVQEDNVHFIKIKQQIEAVLEGISSSRKIYARIRAILYPILYLVFYFMAIIFRQNTGMFFLFYGLMGISTVLIFLNLIHEAVHNTIFKKRWQNNTLLYFFDLIGANSYIWKKRHVVLHHGFQNISGWDSDIEQASLFRVYPHEEKKKFHSFQHRIIIIFYPLYLINWVLVRDFKDFFKKKQLVRKICTIPIKEYIILFTFKFFFIFYTIITPFILGVPLVQAILAMLFMLMIAGTIALNFLLTPHVNVTNEFPVPDSSGQLPSSWLKHQFATTNDVSLNNWFTRNLLGNFNFHLAHHLFPRISAIYAPEITEVIQKYATENHLGYRSYSLTQALSYHFKLIKNNAVSLEIMEKDM